MQAKYFSIPIRDEEDDFAAVENFEKRGFNYERIITRPYSLIIKTPRKRTLSWDYLKTFYYDTILEHGNRDHIENVTALEYFEALSMLFDDINCFFLEMTLRPFIKSV